jgi:hypothetical protein
MWLPLHEVKHHENYAIERPESCKLFNSIVDEVDTTCFGAVFVVSMAHWIGAM